MSHEKGRRGGFLFVGLAISAAVALWQFYVFVTFRNGEGVTDLQGGKVHLGVAILFGVLALLAAFLLLSRTVQYDRGSELHITSPPTSNNA